MRLQLPTSNTVTAINSETCVKRPLSKRPKIGFQDQLSLNAGQKNCRMLQREHSAILPSSIKHPFVIKTFVLSFFEWPFYTGITVHYNGPYGYSNIRHCTVSAIPPRFLY